MNEKQTRLTKLRQLAQTLETKLNELQQSSDRYTNIRLVTFLAGALVSGITLLSSGVWPWLAVSTVVMVPFVLSVRHHRRIESHITQDKILLNLKRTQIARMILDWDEMPEPLVVDTGPEHPFANDLDLVGHRSLHQLIDTAVSCEGSQRLCDWLLDTHHNEAKIRDRQERIRELTTLPDFCDDLILNATLVPSQSAEKWPGQRLLDWLADNQNASSPKPALRLLIPLAGINIILGVLYALDILGPWWSLTWLLYLAVSFLQVRKVGRLFENAFFLLDGMGRLGRLFGFLEAYDYSDNQKLRQLCKPFIDEKERPSQQLKKVTRVVVAAGLQKNQMLWLALNAIIPWDIYFAHQLNQRKKKLSVLLPRWLDVWFELEASTSLASFAYLNPATIFPDITFSDGDSGSNLPRFHTNGLGHPLLPDEQRICNDFVIDRLGAIFLITGSNMSGKSTFLRTVGINMVLAYAGGPVIADSMQLSLFRLFAAVKVSDSIVDGFSYFYAEVRRLRALLSELESENGTPLLFLIDEIFRGTNNRERLIGSRAYIKQLAGGRGIGFIATHDLELVNLADEIPGISNHHFRDDVQDGRMIFDYKLHAGPCPTTNALKIMRQAGLPIGDAA